MTGPTEARRSGCPISFALDLFGDRWTLLVLRDILLAGKRSFQYMLASEEGIATNILTDRLKRLEARGLIRRKRDPEDARKLIYLPTPFAVSLVPVLLELIVWGAENDPQSMVSADFTRSYRGDRNAVIEDFRARALRYMEPDG